ncbi:hypothetical protein ABL840_09145 [Variovorax sp. NFACC27]|uniref:structural cement protein Gp24 n=1 Tax=unclassified Variovorax TaxID=663243 RepID=UPI000896D149|nr:hypothetical protein SAMN03159371_05269 [Variovorax sp. NFACC28]SEG89670.1 hypothetical protein SAMN03159365_05178 [Variovorax sp. NFACC29]SFD40221.1 hypothetical protein SAMN03159379_05159 [Variovorax sp. NFACC26]SFG42503.1 hypothetical protein SAMN03159447_03269 [Variovorax sp. NFACC27]
MTFQTQVNLQPAPAVEGDFASANPRATVLAGPGALVSGAAGVTVGQFAWADANGVVSNAYGSGGRIGFVHREQQALITIFLAETSMVVPQGFPITLHQAGDFWDKFAGGASIGQKVYASYADGSASAAATGTPPTNALIVANTATNTTLTVTANTGAPIVVGQPISGAGIQAGTVISALGTGTGGAGTYTLSLATTATATGVTITAQTAKETNFVVQSAAAAGELAKISTWG